MVLCVATFVNVQIIWHNIPMIVRTDKKLEKAVGEVLNYFYIFKYAPTTAHIYAYITYKVSRAELERSLVAMENEGIIVHEILIYTGECIWYWTDKKGLYANRSVKYQETEKKLKKVSIFFNFMTYLPYIHFVGVSGSCAMHNASKKDDIDVFIISAPGGMWVARLSAICVAKILGIHRKKGMKDTADTICLNLFFDGAHLEIPAHKRNLYTAHEIVQITPMVVRGGVYANFLYHNNWVKEYFPNSMVPQKPKKVMQSKPSLFLRFLNMCARLMQTPKIFQTKTTEHISDEQLWFFPDDFQKKVENEIDILP